MKLLVVGGAGYIGSHTVRQLRAAGHRVVVLDNLSSGHAEALPDDVELIKADLLDFPSVKAALEASVRYLAHELGPAGIRVNAISAGPVRTRAASGIKHFDELLDEAARRSPQRRVVEGCEVGRVALLLASQYASAITGEVMHVDAGFHIEGMAFH